MGLLDRFDRANQRVADYQRAHPDLGTKPFPYAKSGKARRWLVLVVLAVILVSFLFGPIGAVVAVIVAIPIVWKLEHHPALKPTDPENDEPPSTSGA